MSSMVLAGDLGGTRLRLALARRNGAHIELLAPEHRDTATLDGLATALKAYLERAPARPARAVIAVAGPVKRGPRGRQARITNLPWVLEEHDLAAATGLERVELLNDFEAVGHALDDLSTTRMATLQAGRHDPGGMRALIGAGTGLGQALVAGAGSALHVYPTEGGHADFAASDAITWALREELASEFGHVSWERLVSGPGLERIYRFLCRQRGVEPTLAQGTHDPPAAVGNAGLDGRDPLAREALDLFCRLYGAQAGNLALTALATGGVYLAGGIAPRILERLRAGGFLAAFRAKGRMAALAEQIPVHVILDPEAGLHGAARYAFGPAAGHAVE